MAAKSYLVSFSIKGCELGATKSTSRPSIKLLTNIIFPAMNLVGKQCSALSPGCKSKKSPVAIAESTIACFSIRINLGAPVVPDVLNST